MIADARLARRRRHIQRRSRRIPSSETAVLAPAARRTRGIIVALAGCAIAVAIALVVVSTQPADVPVALRGGDGLMVVVDVSSSTLGFSDMIARSLLTLARNPGQRAGLVLASQSAYVALPPETPGSALRGWQRMVTYINKQNHKLAIRAKLDRTPLPDPAPGDYPWVGVFTGGTRLSAGLATAMQALRDAGVRHGQIVLISDLRDAPQDLPRVGALISRMHELGMRLRIVTVGEATRNPKEFSDLGGAQFISSASDAVYAPNHPTSPATKPAVLPFVLLGVALALILAATELFVPLRWRSREGTQ
jgi:hypothetical protein